MEKSKTYNELINLGSIALRGDFKTRMIWLNGKELTPEYSRTIYDHSAHGFDWGNTGDGSAQLALAVLLELTQNRRISMILHHLFKNDFISNIPKSDFKIDISIGEWFDKNLSKT